MEAHDIRYLNDSDAKPLTPRKKLHFSRFTSLQLLGILTLGMLLVSITSTVFLLTQKTTVTTSAKSPRFSPTTDSDKNAREEVEEGVEIEGEIVCIGKVTPIPGSSACELGLQESSGTVYALKNVKYDDVALGKVTPGKELVVTGNIITTKKSGEEGQPHTGGALYVSSVKESGFLASGIKGGSTPQATQTPTNAPTPTPYPFTVPEPGVFYYSVKYIVDNKDTFAGKDVPLKAAVVSEQQIEDGCGDPCTQAHFLVNDSADSSRDSVYDTTLITHATEEGQIVFNPGQILYASVRVTLSEGQVIFLLNIVD